MIQTGWTHVFILERAPSRLMAQCSAARGLQTSSTGRGAERDTL